MEALNIYNKYHLWELYIIVHNFKLIANLLVKEKCIEKNKQS